MAVVFWSKLNFSAVFLFEVVCTVFVRATGALTSATLGNELKHFRSVSQPTSPPLQVRLHPGVIASVFIVSIAAVVAAIYIIRKYCFPQSDVPYRYSVLRQMEEQSATRGEDQSDEDLLE